MKAAEVKELTVEDDFQIKIDVRDPITDPAGHHTYLIVGTDKVGPFEVRRRFREFFLLRQTMQRRWVGLYIPPLPEKKAIGNKESRFIEERKRGLYFFLKRLSEVKYLYYADQFQCFLRSKEADKALQSLPPVIPSVTRERYFQIFGKVLASADRESAGGRVAAFAAYLKNSQKNLKLIAEPVVGLSDSYRNYLDNFAIFGELLMPEFEKNVMEQYYSEQKDLFIFGPDGDVHARAVELRNQIVNTSGVQQIADIFRNQYNENEAMLKAIEDRNSLQGSQKKLEEKRNSLQAEKGKLKSGKSTFKSFFSKGSKEEQVVELDRQIEELKRDISSNQEIVQLLSVVMSEVEITKYKNRKLALYVRAMQQASSYEQNFLVMYRDYLGSIAEQNDKLFSSIPAV